MSKKKDRIQQINRMLLEMASGNFFFRLERSDQEDNLEAMTVILNMLAEEIQESLVHQGHISTRGLTKHIVQMCFLLDEDGAVQMINQKTCVILSDLYTSIIGKPFEYFLTEASKEKWLKTRELLHKKNFYDTSLELTFKSNEDLLIPNTCYITTCKEAATDNKRKTLITIIHQTKGAYELEKELKKSVLDFKNEEEPIFKGYTGKKRRIVELTSDDFRRVREGRDIIINNLEKDLPNLKDFALQLGTNEFKLKHGFRELYGVSVHQYIIRERMRKAKMLIQYSKIPLKSIAFMVGYKTNSYFSKTFIKRYGYSPSDLRKKSLEAES